MTTKVNSNLPALVAGHRWLDVPGPEFGEDVRLPCIRRTQRLQFSVPKVLRFFKNAETLRFSCDASEIAVIFCIFSAVFLRFFCDRCSRTCDLALHGLKRNDSMLAIFGDTKGCNGWGPVPTIFLGGVSTIGSRFRLPGELRFKALPEIRRPKTPIDMVVSSKHTTNAKTPQTGTAKCTRNGPF